MLFDNMLVSSPRTWGCFRQDIPYHHRAVVFPTHVGVFPSYKPSPATSWRLPHARGGVSVNNDFMCWLVASSPRTWGCFYGETDQVSFFKVFPTHVGLFPGGCSWRNCWLRLPHARGGVSEQGSHNARDSMVFPTHVGVFRSKPRPRQLNGILPHVRGGCFRSAYPARWHTASILCPSGAITKAA